MGPRRLLPKTFTSYEYLPVPQMAGHGADDLLPVVALDGGQRTEFEEEKKLPLVDNIASSIDHELDGIHDGLVFPNEHERETLRRVSDTIPWNSYCKSVPHA